MFNIILGISLDETNKIVKTFSQLTPYAGTLREECSILSPSFVIATDADLTQYNYAYIEAYSRYYFITDITSVREGLWRISLRCDVLMTYADEILQQTAIISRQENLFNTYLPDTMATYANSDVVTKAFPNRFNSDEYSYVLVTAGGASNG